MRCLYLIIILINIGVYGQNIKFGGKQVSSMGLRHSFLVTGSQTCIIAEDDRIVWQVKGNSRDGQVLPNGNILITYYREIIEYNRDKKLIWSYKVSPGNSELATAYRIKNGNTLIVECGKKPRLIEVDKNSKIVVEVPLQAETNHAHMQTRMARKLPNGNYIVPHLLAFAVKEYNSKGEVVNTINTDLEELGGRKGRNWPFTAILLDNGNFLINLTNGHKTAEMTKAGKVVWRADNSSALGRFADPCGGQVLDNGNRVIASYGQNDPSKARIFELDKNKNVVWEYFHPQIKAHHIHILSTNGVKENGTKR